MPLARGYKVERVFQTKILAGMWATDIVDIRVKLLDGNRNAQVFSNGTYFSEIYPITTKADV